MSYSATEIVSRLDGSGKMTERIGSLGLILTGLTCIVTPLSLLTSYYGMNVGDFVEGASTTLFEFWRIALPTVTLSLAFLVLVLVRFMPGSS